MQKRLFTAVSLPKDVKKRLFWFAEKEFEDLPLRLVQRENMHLTLNFLGYISEENIPEICVNISQAVENISSFELEFQKIEFGPNKERKKMIWASGGKSEELKNLKYQLDRALGFLTKEKKEFNHHITLGRIRKEKWKKILPEPTVEKEFVFSVPINSIELFESKFEKGKRIYYVLESFPLK